MTSLLRLLALAILAACFAPTIFAQDAAQRLKALGDEMVQGEFDLMPALETFNLGAGPRAGRTVQDLSPGFRERARALYRGTLEKLAAIPRAELSTADRVNYDLLKLRAASEMAETEYPLAELGIINPSWGLLSILISTATGSQPLRNEADFEAWLARL